MANFTAISDYPAEFLRGWPVDGALELDFPIASGQNLKAGQTVILTTGGEVTVTTADTVRSGIVVRGNVDDKSVAASNKALVLWGHYIVKLSTKAADGLVDQTDKATFAFGDEVGGNAAGIWGYVTGGEGMILEYNATAEYVVIAVK